MDSPDTKGRRNLTLPELTHSHALKPWDSAVTRRLGASARVLPSWVCSRTRDCAQPLLSETFKVGRPFSATNSFETFTHWKISQRNQCFTSQRTVHQPVVNLEDGHPVKSSVQNVETSFFRRRNLTFASNESVIDSPSPVKTSLLHSCLRRSLTFGRTILTFLLLENLRTTCS